MSNALLARIGECRVVFKGRGSNGVADRTAKEAVLLQSNAPNLYSVMPVWLNSAVDADKQWMFLILVK